MKIIKKIITPLILCASIALFSSCSKIAFVSFRDGGWGEIYKMRSDGYNIKQLTENPLADTQPSWPK